MGNLDYQSDDEVMGDYSFEPLPKGTYYAAIVESEVRETSSGSGTGINLKLEIMEGDYAGRFLFVWINFQHQNEKTQQIGRKELNTIMQACGFGPGYNLSDTSELHGHAMVIDVIIKGNKQTKEPENRIVGYASASEDGGVTGGEAKQSAPAKTTAKSNSSGSSTPAWKK